MSMQGIYAYELAINKNIWRSHLHDGNMSLRDENALVEVKLAVVAVCDIFNNGPNIICIEYPRAQRRSLDTMPQEERLEVLEALWERPWRLLALVGGEKEQIPSDHSVDDRKHYRRLQRRQLALLAEGVEVHVHVKEQVQR